MKKKKKSIVKGFYIYSYRVRIQKKWVYKIIPLGRSQRAGSAALPTDIVDGPWAREEWKLSEVDMGVVGSMAMGLSWKERGR